MKNVRNLLLAALVLLLALAAPASAAAAGIVTPFPAESAGGKIALALSDCLGIPMLPDGAEDSGEAANRMLADPDVLLLDSQAAPIAGLQGYTDEDLREAMVPVCLVAESPLFVVMDESTAESLGIRDAETLAAWISDHEYELTFARHTGADTVDRAVTLLGNEAAILTDYFLPEEIPEVLHSGEADCAVMSGAELAADADGLRILCCLGSRRSEAFPDIPCAEEAGLPACRGESLWLFASAKADPAVLQQFADTVTAAELPMPAGFERRDLKGSAVQEDLQALFADLKGYMTSEGLFFYEE